MVTMKKIFRWIGFGILLIFVLIVGVRTADYIDEEREKKAELAYKTNIKWEWHDEYERVQISKKPIFDDNRSVLRKVSMEEGWTLWAYKLFDDRLLEFRVSFHVDCEPNTEIVTSRNFSDGKPLKLICSPDGKNLAYWFGYSSDYLNEDIDEDIDGFKFKVDLSRWDFSKLDREITLLKAVKA